MDLLDLAEKLDREGAWECVEEGAFDPARWAVIEEEGGTWAVVAAGDSSDPESLGGFASETEAREVMRESIQAYTRSYL